MHRFDTVITVDWSASGQPSPARPSPDAIWLGVARTGGAEATSYHRTRAGAERALTEMLEDEAAQGRRVLVGFDFPMGYPAGFAQKLTGDPSAKAVWRWLAARIEDGPSNRNNRFALSASINLAFGGGPFWGRPAGLDLAGLSARKTVDYPALGLAERRLVERMVPRAQPVWKLFTTGSVGSQALMGLPMIHRLAQRPGTTVWPFDPSLGDVVLAEVYPSLLAPAVAVEPGIKDAVQVRLLSRAVLALSEQGRLSPLFGTPGAPVTTEEGWILGAGHSEALLAALKPVGAR